ncbi:hypothetical protein C1Y63_10420 [Corynebacterium sp. 13CS0277]|uniref:hypothetical protein n=1 Tax=Corynebacterium sp. 13CS0277 TaxID=2071994 RepID=UPI000D03D629|nr:hypothetical protein [Corynebacterium sp. 13CS0277]PRQ10601.1 hypothetical protein C1Y63_10420 [Corynebacterium sp. 13CS0277]
MNDRETPTMNSPLWAHMDHIRHRMDCCADNITTVLDEVHERAKNVGELYNIRMPACEDLHSNVEYYTTLMDWLIMMGEYAHNELEDFDKMGRHG